MWIQPFLNHNLIWSRQVCQSKQKNYFKQNVMIHLTKILLRGWNGLFISKFEKEGANFLSVK